ncbi:MAG: ABC transporter substrate-binding protein [Ottowia sp.]|nr:ABC transporter substrate-binding protein [Ottowia sp.]
MSLKRKILFFACALATSTLVLAQTQGVSKDTITIGTIQDLSGPLAGFGKQVRDGMQLRVDELNEQGGIDGRKVVLKVEDSGYDPKRAVLAAQKLVNQDKIFAMLGHIGTAGNVATFPILFKKNVINFFPVTAARQMYEPVHRMKWSFASTYYDQARLAGPILIKEKNAENVCVIYQDDDFGQEVLQGAEDAVKSLGMTLVEKTSFKRGATDFSSQVAKMKAANCDFVFLGTLIRETIGTIGEARKTGFDPVFLGTAGAYTELIHKLGGPAMDGLYAAMTVEHPYLDAASDQIRFWANKYKTKFGEDPAVFSVYGYMIVGYFAQVAESVGPNLTADGFADAMEKATLPANMFGADEMTFSPTKHLGSNRSRLSQIQDGRWVVVSDYIGDH